MNVQLPIRFQAELIPARWSIVQGFAETWVLSGSGRFFGLRVRIPAAVGTSKSTVAFFSLEDLNSSWAARLTEEKRRILKREYTADLGKGRDEPIELLACRPVRGKDTIRVHDVHNLREEFFNLNERTDDLLEFLNRYGMWRLHCNPFGAGWTPVLSTQENPFGDALLGLGNEERRHAQNVTPGAIWRDRAQLKERMRSGSGSLPSWFVNSRHRMVLEPIDKFPFQAFTVRSIGDAIEVSIGLDLLQGSHFALCARADCSKPFEVTRKAKQYCSYDCAHLEVVRRSRRPRTRRKG